MKGRALVGCVAISVLGVALARCSLDIPDGCVANETCANATTASDAGATEDAPEGACSDDNDCGTDGDASQASDAPAAPVDSPVQEVAVDVVDAADAPDAGDVAEVSACDPTLPPHDAPCALADAYGVFVAPPPLIDAGVDAGSPSAGSEAGTEDGSTGAPYTSIGRALGHLGTKVRVYVCNGAYEEAVSVPSAVSIFGGLSCTVDAGGRAWSYVGGAAQVNAPTGQVAVTVRGVTAGTVTIADMAFSSPSAIAAGGSSIAAFVSSSNIELVRVTLSAGSGAPGAAGATVPNYTGAAPDGGAQLTNGGGFAIAAGAGGVNTCLRAGSSAGGDGGAGCGLGMGFGTPGTSNPVAPVTAPGRDGLPRGVALPDGGTTAADDPGADGLANDGGVAALDGYGVLSATAWTPSAGSDGAIGSPGQGGSGGSDPLSNTNCAAPTTSIGGGGGGAGGCGGAGGEGGAGGGASIALAAFSSTVDLQSCVLTTSAGGTGGAGGAGQDGQPGGLGGDDSVSPYAHAPGAAGGNGAGGSGGAGGTGGISVGVLTVGGAVTQDGATAQGITLGAPGAGGAAGAAGRHSPGGTGSDGNPGAPGTAGTAAAVLHLM